MAITSRQFNTLEDLFDYYNAALFDGQLPDCLVNLSRHKGAHGFFAPERWKDKDTKTVKHEISLNPDTIHRPDKAWHSTLVHEMVHLWQEFAGNPSRQAYHNKEWAAKMEQVGLMPSDTGAPGGKKTGQSMTHYVIEGGPFEKAFVAINAKDLANLKLPYLPNTQFRANAPGITSPGTDDPEGGEGQPGNTASRSGVKVKYICSCQHKVWGKPDLHLQCMDCGQPFTPELPKPKKTLNLDLN